MKDFAKKLQEARIRKGLMQKELAEKIKRELKNKFKS